MTRFERFSALRARTVTTQESHISPALHTDAAAMRLLNLHYFGFEIAQSISRRLSRILLLLEDFSVHCDALVDDRMARQALFHAQPALFTAHLVIAGLEGDHQTDLVANEALLRHLEWRFQVEGRWWLGRHVAFLTDLLLSADVFR